MFYKLLLSTCCIFLVQLKSISSEPFICPGTNRYPNPESADCRTYYLCQLNSDGILQAKLTKCPGTTVFDGSQNKCVAASFYTCPGPIASTTAISNTEITSTESPNGFYCPAEGRFENPDSSDCKTFYSCVKNSDGNVVSTLFFCPGNTIFSSQQNKCVATSMFTCPIGITTSTEESSTDTVTTSVPIITTTVPNPPEPSTTTTIPSTEQPTTSESTTTATPNVFTCVASGRFPNPEQPNCQSYKYCLQTAATTFQEYTFRCPAGSNFNPLESRCSAGYICQKTQTTTTTEVSPPTTTEAVASAFVCEVEGRFPDPESCNQYIFCTRATDGNLVQHAFKCPPNSWFKPNESRCSASYVCK